MADDSKSGALKISSREELQDWLESLPPEQGLWVAAAIATRAVLRGLPYLALTQWTELAFTHHVSNHTFPAFLASALARVASQYPHFVEALPLAHTANATIVRGPDSNDSVVQQVLVAANGALVAVARAAKVLRDDKNARTAIGAAAGFNVGDPYFRAALRHDVAFITSGGGIPALTSEPLWPSGAPEWMAIRWRNLQAELPREDDWQVWIDCYNRRLEGMSDPEEIELVFATVPDEEREAGPTAANKWIRERLEELARKKPIVPPMLPAAIEPVVAGGKIALPANPADADLDSEALDAALIALRMQIVDLAGDLDVEANIDKRVIGFLRQLAEKTPQTPPTQAQLFMLAHEQETLEAYGKTVTVEWPTLLAGRYLATTLAFDRTVRQFPKWRLFKQNADKNRLTDQQRAETSKLVADFTAALREEGAAEYVAAEIPDTFEEMCRRLDAARDEAGKDRIAAGVDTLAEDAVVSIENTLKLMAETALAGVKRAASAITKAGAAYVDNFEEGMIDQAKKEGKKDSAALVKWTKRILVSAAVGAGAKAAGIGTVIAKLMVTYPQIGKWLGPIIDLISN